MFDAWTDSLNENSRESGFPELKLGSLLYLHLADSVVHSYTDEFWRKVKTAHHMAMCWHLFSMNLFGIQRVPI